jgi:hypothetical protein
MTAAVRDGVLAPPMPAATIGPGVVLAGDPRAGQLFVQAPVRRDGVTGLFDDVVGRGWTLLSPFRDPVALLDDESAAFFASIGGIGAQVGNGAPIEDVSGGYREWFAAAGVEVALQRPDFYLFGTARRADDTPALVRELRRSLGTRGA